jgi:1-phosphatidylinositol-3-phosphate 5-kinase
MLGTPGTRVTSIARHFDRLQREAERERQKRVSNNRNKRARPVTVTKAKVEVFNNLRDAFKDEFDTDSSSEADNEEDDEMGGYESTESKPGSKASSPTKSRQVSPKKKSIKTPQPVSVAANAEGEGQITTTPDYMTISASSSSATGQSGFSDQRSEMSYTDRLQIELPSFETSAPLPSMPVTPQMSNTDTADEGGRYNVMSQMSEGEMSSGPERSSIIKTLTGLWAFRAGEFSPLEYPL